MLYLLRNLLGFGKIDNSIELETQEELEKRKQKLVKELEDIKQQEEIQRMQTLPIFKKIIASASYSNELVRALKKIIGVIETDTIESLESEDYSYKYYRAELQKHLHQLVKMQTLFFSDNRILFPSVIDALQKVHRDLQINTSDWSEEQRESFEESGIDLDDFIEKQKESNEHLRTFESLLNKVITDTTHLQKECEIIEADLQRNKDIFHQHHLRKNKQQNDFREMKPILMDLIKDFRNGIDAYRKQKESNPEGFENLFNQLDSAEQIKNLQSEKELLILENERFQEENINYFREVKHYKKQRKAFKDQIKTRDTNYQEAVVGKDLYQSLELKTEKLEQDNNQLLREKSDIQQRYQRLSKEYRSHLEGKHLSTGEETKFPEKHEDQPNSITTEKNPKFPEEDEDEPDSITTEN